MLAGKYFSSVLIYLFVGCTLSLLDMFTAAHAESNKAVTGGMIIVNMFIIIIIALLHDYQCSKLSENL